MDIEKIRKLSKKASEAGELVKAVTAFKNELKDKEQMYDVTMSEHFKTLREPLIEQQKKTDEKQDKVIEQLQKNQLALTSGIQDIMTLNRELPQLEPEDFGDPRELAAPDEKVLIADINKKFNKEDFEYFEKNLIYPPTELLKLTAKQLNDYEEVIKKLNKKITTDLAGLRRTKKEDVSHKIKEKESEQQTMKKYAKAIEHVLISHSYLATPTPSPSPSSSPSPPSSTPSSPKPKKGKGLKQPKRNAYKIQDGQYGGLVIDLPRLFNEMKLNVYRGGKLLYSADADKSLINLITKRFNPKTKYSINAVRIFNDLNTLANMPNHRSSGKTRMVGSSVTYYNDLNQLADRMKILVGSIAAGNNSPLIRNDLSQINDELLRIGAIDQSLHEKFFKKYLSR